MRVFTVALDDVNARRLREIAQRDRRRPADQAAVLLERALSRRPSRDPDTLAGARTDGAGGRG